MKQSFRMKMIVLLNKSKSWNKESSRETIQILEEKIAKIEAKAMKDYKDSSDKNDTLKNIPDVLQHRP